MQVDLIKRIRKTLGINPTSKSTLVTKLDLLRYAKIMHQGNQQLRQITQPKVAGEVEQAEAKLQEINVRLFAYEAELRSEKERHQTLQSTIAHYRTFLNDSQRMVEEHQRRIEEIKSMNQCEHQQKVEVGNMDSILTVSSGERGGDEGDKAMMRLMKQFIAFEKEAEGDI